MFNRVSEWLFRKWRLRHNDFTLSAYATAFSTAEGRAVLQHLMDTIYCTISESTDPIAVATHNGQRSVIQAILENIDRAQQPMKYIVTTTTTDAAGAAKPGERNGRLV